MKDPRKVKADIAKALDNHSLPLHSCAYISYLAESVIAQKLSEHKVAAHTRGFSPAIDTTLAKELTGCTSGGVDLLFTVDVGVGILNPRHYFLARSHVRSQYIILRSYEGLLGKFHGILPGDLF